MKLRVRIIGVLKEIGGLILICENSAMQRIRSRSMHGRLLLDIAFNFEC